MVEIVESKPSVLVVDDNPLIVNVLRSLLGAQDFQVTSASNGREALDLLDKKLFDVIVCDVMMPKMDGYAFHNQVREKAELAHIPFVFLTALDGRSEVKMGKEIGADDYVTKPFDPEDLLAVIRGKVVRANVLKQSAENRYESYRKRVIHTLSHEFRTPLVAINTGTEMLLETLVQQHGNLDSQKIENLLEAVHRGGQRLERLVNDFMLLQQIEAGVAQKLFDTRSELTSVNSVLELVQNANRKSLEEAGFKFTVQNLTDGARIRVYEVQLCEIFNRIISNAIKFSTERKEIEIFAYLQEGTTVIEVRDRGIGFDPVKVRDAVEAFGQLNRERLEQQGGGLGLTIANRYAHINRCKLTFSSREGGGAAVGIVIPLA